MATCPQVGHSAHAPGQCPNTGKHTVDPNPEQQAYDVCLHCGKAIQDDAYGRGLITMVEGNPECYGRRA